MEKKKSVTKVIVLTHQRGASMAGELLTALAAEGMARTVVWDLHWRRSPYSPAVAFTFRRGQQGAALEEIVFAPLAGRDGTDEKAWSTSLSRIPQIAQFMGFDPQRINLDQRLSETAGASFVADDEQDGVHSSYLSLALSRRATAQLVKRISIALEPSEELACLMETQKIDALTLLTGSLACEADDNDRGYEGLTGAEELLARAEATLFCATGEERSFGAFWSPFPAALTFLRSGPVILAGTRSHLFAGKPAAQVTAQALAADPWTCLEVFDKAEKYLNVLRDMGETPSGQAELPSDLEMGWAFLPSVQCSAAEYEQVYRPAALTLMELVLRESCATAADRAAARSDELREALLDTVTRLTRFYDRDRACFQAEYGPCITAVTGIWQDFTQEILTQPPEEILGANGGIGTRRHGSRYRFPLAAALAILSKKLLDEAISHIPSPRTRWEVQRMADQSLRDGSLPSLSGFPILSRSFILDGVLAARAGHKEGALPLLEAMESICRLAVEELRHAGDQDL